MTDVVVALPKSFGLDRWLAEAAAPGTPRQPGRFYYWRLGRQAPAIEMGERVYVVHDGRLIGYAPLVALHEEGGVIYLVRGGGAVACTIDEEINGFRGFRYRWWDPDAERTYLQPCCESGCEAFADSLYHSYDPLCDGCGEPFCEDHLFEYDGWGDDGSGQHVTKLAAPLCAGCVESAREPLEVD